jgi:hypothetical protein
MMETCPMGEIACGRWPLYKGSPIGNCPEGVISS